jgi:hypothetical protein
LILPLYAPQDSDILICDAVIIHNGGMNKDGSYADSTQKAFQKALLIAKKFPDSTLYVGAPGFNKNEQDHEIKKMIEEATDRGISKIIALKKGPKNTVEEVAMATSEFKNVPKNLVIVCDKPQMRSVRLIWNHYLPNSHVQVLGIKADWSKRHRALSLSSNLGALLTNLIRHVMLIVLGVEKTGRVVNPQN